ncbi:hypothetical protein EUTSA_v10000558mg [Eutrema salsugineum]|uniref:F-box domain-containing protein n=2 Tax=Eutrema salsugineum TaxID=72664 RepID=V4NIL2_EUTSA|nr:hypothetical protein EUTSA_v10000558mg [Eutrema salsugineum]
MAVTSETPDGSNGGDPNKKPEDVEKEEEEEENQKEKPEDEEEEEIQYRSISFPNLPHDLTELCVALLRRCNYPSLSLISKGFRTLAASPRLYDARSRLGVTECVLYASIGFPTSSSPSWYILRRDEISLRLCRIDKLPIHWGSAVVTIGPTMYVIGGRSDGKPTSDVTLIDCRFHT